VDLAKGQRFDLVLTAVPTSGHLRIAASPGGATIEVDRRQVGAGSWEGEVTPGPHHIDVALGDVHAARDVVVDRGATVVQEIPLAVSAEAPPEYSGLYGQLSPIFLVPTMKRQDVHSAGPITLGNQGGWGGEFGASLRIGYGFGVFSAELVGVFSFAAYQDDYQIQGLTGCTANGSSNSVAFGSANGFVGPAARITSQSPILRLTAGLALGATIRNFTVGRCSEPGSIGPGSKDNSFSSNAGYVDPGMLLDAGMLLGSTPGWKFSLGVVAWVDFPSKDVTIGPDPAPTAYYPDSFFTAPGRGYLLASGPQVFLGPTLGIQFGH
jgi:hypothetical protein